MEDADAVASFESDLVVVLEVGEPIADKAVPKGVVFPCDASAFDESGPSSLSNSKALKASSKSLVFYR